MPYLKQFPDSLSRASWRQDDLVVQPHETLTFTFHDTLPNMFVLSNPNEAVLKIGVSHIPLTNRYEFSVQPNSQGTFGRPIGTKQIHIFNDSSVAVQCMLFSFADKFDPVILKDMTVGLSDLSLTANSEISGVANGVTLPVADNTAREHLYSIKDTAYAHYQTALLMKSVLDTIASNTAGGGAGGGSDVDYSTDLDSIISNLGGMGNAITNMWTYLNEMRQRQKAFDDQGLSIYGNGATSFSYTSTGGATIAAFSYIINDGADFDIVRDGTTILTVKAGEVLTDLGIYVPGNKTLTFSGSDLNVRYRYRGV